MTTTDQQETEHYGEEIASEIRTLEIVLGGKVMTEAEGLVAFDMLTDMADQAGEDFAPYSASVMDYLNAYCLEVKVLGERKGNDLDEWDITGIRILRTFGGPNCSMTIENDDIVITTNWGGTQDKRHVYAPNVTSALMDLYEE